jgi:hypothetical protein
MVAFGLLAEQKLADASEAMGAAGFDNRINAHHALDAVFSFVAFTGITHWRLKCALTAASGEAAAALSVGRADDFLEAARRRFEADQSLQAIDVAIDNLAALHGFDAGAARKAAGIERHESALVGGLSPEVVREAESLLARFFDGRYPEIPGLGVK